MKFIIFYTLCKQLVAAAKAGKPLDEIIQRIVTKVDSFDLKAEEEQND